MPIDTAAVAALIGTTASASVDVTPTATAASMASGDLPVLATPRMVALMEEAACLALAPALPPEFTSVGTRVDVRHQAASPLGVTVTALARITAVDGSRVSFEVTATHAVAGDLVVVGEGTHTRVIVEREPFLARVARP